ncbi:hypothetical protein [Planotetraspora mira]|uniref:hypothetical protein n=1 Tax=Planotetraspora mira TaxID=58121 RepID=UPI001EF39CD1|nr:hypothetical protein [Planotetraspora mira]
MVDAAVGVLAAILGGQRGVVELHARVDVGDDDAFTAVAEFVPYARGVDAVDVPLDRVDRRDGLARQRGGQPDDLVGCDLLDFGQLRDLGCQLGVARHLDGVDDPERGEVGVLGVEELAQVRLRRRGLLGLGLEDLLGLLGLGLRRAGRAEVGGALQTHPEGGLVVLGQVCFDGFVDLGRLGCCRGRAVRRALGDEECEGGYGPYQGRSPVTRGAGHTISFTQAGVSRRGKRSGPYVIFTAHAENGESIM